ncbi:MAG: type II toxin-antitoxin system HicB family antitoxin [Saprospiraceae bacterium]
MSAQARTQPQLLFFVSQDSDGTYVAKAPRYSIYTQGDTWEGLIANIKEAILCHFEEGEAPASFAWQMVKREVVMV